MSGNHHAWQGGGKLGDRLYIDHTSDIRAAVTYINAHAGWALGWRMCRGRHSGVSFPDGNADTDTTATSSVVDTALFRLCLSAQTYTSDINPVLDGRMTGWSRMRKWINLLLFAVEKYIPVFDVFRVRIARTILPGF
jgi:hypothetical protein